MESALRKASLLFVACTLALASVQEQTCQSSGCLDDASIDDVSMLQLRSGSGLPLSRAGTPAPDYAAMMPVIAPVMKKLTDPDNLPTCAPTIHKFFEGRQQTIGLCGFFNNSVQPWKYWGTQREVDLDRPLVDVARDHPNISLYVWFDGVTDWITAGQGSMTGAGYEGYRKGLQLPSDMWNKDGTGPERSFSWDAGKITTHFDSCQAADDPYCYSLGWLKNQNMNGSLMNDAEAWNNLGVEQCRKMKATYHFTDEEMTLGGHINETNAMYEKTDNACSKKEPIVTARDYAKHAYAKCFLNNVTTEMAYCYFRGCVLDNNVIGHDSQCGY